MSGSELKKCPILRGRKVKRGTRLANAGAQMPEKVDVRRYIYITRVEKRYSGEVEGGGRRGAEQED